MIRRTKRILLASICMTPLVAFAQALNGESSPYRLYQQGSELYHQKAYGAAITPLKEFLKQSQTERALAGYRKGAAEADYRQEAAYMLACSAYEMNDEERIEKLLGFLVDFPDTPHAHRVYALIGSAYFEQEAYEKALEQFESARVDLLANEEREDMTYRMALSMLKTGEMEKAAIWMETLLNTTPRYAEDASYYLAYIHYARQRYTEATKGFESLKGSHKYGVKASCYLAEIHIIHQEWKEAEELAEAYLKSHSEEKEAPQMYRVRGTARYSRGNYIAAREDFKRYAEQCGESPRRDALYMQGLSCYECGVFSEAAQSLLRVTEGAEDALTQNAYLHLGLSYLQASDKPRARMAFEQAAAMSNDMKIKEQAAYNYALSLHETSYSAFGESVKVFENFLNEFPQSPYTDRVSDYIVEVYMNTRNYEAALQSISRISRPSATILEAKQRILFQLGTQAMANAQFDMAEQYFNQSIALGNCNRQTLADTHYWSGEACYRQGEMERALNHFQLYLTLNQQTRGTTLALTHYNLGYIYFNRKAYSQAQPMFSKFLSLEQGENLTARADAYNRLGDCAFQVRAFEQAKVYYLQAEQQRTAVGDYACYQLALVAGVQKRYGEKVALLNQLQQRYPQSPYIAHALYEKGRSQVQQNQKTEAIATFTQLLKRYPNHPINCKAGAEIGLLYYQQGDTQRAIEAYKQVVTKYPGTEEARLAMRDLKSIYVDADRVNEYAELVNRLPGQARMDVHEQDSLTYIAAERIYMRGEKEGARQSLERYLNQYPQGAFLLPAHYYLCLIGAEQQQTEAILAHSEPLMQYPGNAYAQEAIALRAATHFNLKMYNDALTDYQLLQSGALSPAQQHLATVGILRSATQLNRDEETITAASQLLSEAKLEPEQRTEALFFRARAYLHSGENDLAMSDLKQIAGDTRSLYGAQAKYLVAELLYRDKQYDAAEQEVLQFIDQSTPHAYWLARSFILLADIYVATGKPSDARQYLLSLQQNYTVEDDIQPMINERLKGLKANP